MSDATAETPELQQPEEDVDTSRRDKVMLLALILLVGIGVRAYHIGHESLQIDEVYSLEASAGHIYDDQQLPTGVVLQNVPDFTSLRDARPIWAIPGSLRRDLQPPIYYILLRIWRDLFGSGDGTIRVLSLVASVAAIVMLFGAVRELNGSTAALWAAAIMAVAGPQILHAQFARSYALVQVPALGAAWALARIQMRGVNPLRLVALGGCTLLMMLVHYFAVAPALALAAYALIRRGKQRTKSVFITFAVAAVLLILWGPVLLAQRRAAAGHLDAALTDSTPSLSRVLARLELVPLSSLAHPLKNSQSYATLMAVLVAVLPLLVVRKNPNLSLWLLWGYATLGMLVALDVGFSATHLALPRYWLLATPAIYAVLATMLAASNGWIRYSLPAIALLYCLISIDQAYEPQHDWRWAAGKVHNLVGPRDLVVYADPGGDSSRWFASYLYLAMRHYNPDLAGPVVLLTAPATPQLRDQLSSNRHYWLIASSDGDAKRIFPGVPTGEGAAFPFIGLLFEIKPHGEQQ